MERDKCEIKSGGKKITELTHILNTYSMNKARLHKSGHLFCQRVLAMTQSNDKNKQQIHAKKR